MKKDVVVANLLSLVCVKIKATIRLKRSLAIFFEESLRSLREFDSRLLLSRRVDQRIIYD